MSFHFAAYGAGSMTKSVNRFSHNLSYNDEELGRWFWILNCPWLSMNVFVYSTFNSRVNVNRAMFRVLLKASIRFILIQMGLCANSLDRCRSWIILVSTNFNQIFEVSICLTIWTNCGKFNEVQVCNITIEGFLEISRKHIDFLFMWFVAFTCWGILHLNKPELNGVHWLIISDYK